MICKENVQSVKDGLLECGDDYSCYSQKGDWMAVAKKDETICDNSWNRMDNIAELDKEIGRADCYTKVAQAKHDVSICNKIKFISDNIPSVLTTQCIGMVEKMTD